MTLDAVIMGIGALLALLPFLGLPSSWHTPLLIAAGLVIIVLGIIVRRRGNALSVTPTHSFVQSTPSAEIAESLQRHDSEEA